MTEGFHRVIRYIAAPLHFYSLISIALLSLIGFIAWKSTGTPRSSLPEWANSLPSHLRPSDSQIKKLEEIRVSIGIPHQDFFAHILGHKQTTKNLQKWMYNNLKSEHPEWSEPRLLEGVLLSRITAPGNHDPLHGSGLFGLDLQDENLEMRGNEIIKKYPTIEELSEAIASEEWAKATPPSPHLVETVEKIARVLESHE